LAPLPRMHLPRRTVRLRLTALYGGLFLASGAGLLAITYALVAGNTSNAYFTVVGHFSRGVAKAVPVQFKDLALPPACALLRLPGACASPVPSASPGPATQASSSGAGPIRPPVPPGGATFIRGFQTILPTPGELHRLLIVSGVALAIMAVVSIWLGWVVGGRVLRPLRSMTATARHISEENLNQRLAVRGPADELKDLGDTIDGLLGRLETAFEAQRRFVANASHELRTPLAMMRTSLDVALGKPQPPAEVKVLAGKLEEGLDQADKLLEGLLLLARAQQAPVGATVEVSLVDLVATALDANREDIGRLHLSVVDATADVPLRGNDTLLARMVANVVDNAVRHNVAGGTVRITTELDGDRIRLVVDNGGALIDAVRTQHLGEPFQRLGADRVADGDGVGLGLSIVKAIVSAHGGTLELRARPTGGLQVVIELPAAVVPV